MIVACIASRPDGLHVASLWTAHISCRAKGRIHDHLQTLQETAERKAEDRKHVKAIAAHAQQQLAHAAEGSAPVPAVKPPKLHAPAARDVPLNISMPLHAAIMPQGIRVSHDQVRTVTRAVDVKQSCDANMQAGSLEQEAG